MKKWLWLVFGFAVLFFVLIIIGYFSKNYSDRYSNNIFDDQYDLGSINENTNENCDIEFSEYLIDPTKVQKLGQVGVVHGSGLYIVERSYISLKNEFEGQRISVYAPVDMTLISGSHYYNPALPLTSMPDYALWFDAGCNVEVALGHLKEVVEDIAVQLPEAKTHSRSEQLERIKFNAGDLIGNFIYKQGDVAGFDFIVRDKKVTNKFINQERYSGNRASNLINGVCPYDFYTGEKKEVYYNLLGGGGGTIFRVKDCGKISRDLAGTISGMWFMDKDIGESIYDGYKNGNYGTTVSIVGDEERITFGNLGPNNVFWIYANNPTYKLPTEVNGEHCYQIYSTNDNNSDGYAYFKVIDDMTMEVYYSPSGQCPSAIPSSAKRYYK